MTPQEARTIADFLAADFENEIPVTVRVIEAATAENLSYSPDAKSMTGLALIRHIVTTDAWFLNSIAEGAFVTGEGESARAAIGTPADGAAMYGSAVPAGFAGVRALSDEKLSEELDFFGMMKMPAVSLLGVAVKHSIHHRGQLSSYLRAMGGKVPGI